MLVVYIIYIIQICNAVPFIICLGGCPTFDSPKTIIPVNIDSPLIFNLPLLSHNIYSISFTRKGKFRKSHTIVI